jgi:hypothetical protein
LPVVEWLFLSDQLLSSVWDREVLMETYVVVRRYTGASALIDAMVQREPEVRELISTVPGFRAYYAARTGSGGAVATVTVCNDKAGTDESTRRAAEWVRANVSGVSMTAPDVTEGETYLTF